MPSKSKAQRRFFGTVVGVQSGKIHPSKVPLTIRKAAKKISRKDAGDFAKTPEKGLPYKIKKEVIAILKELTEPMYLNEGESVEPIAKTFQQQGDYESYILKFVGHLFLPKELESISNHKEQKPSKIEKNQIRYETTDGFNNGTTTVIKKLQDGGQFAYTAFTKYDTAKPKPKPSENPIEPEQNKSENPIVVSKSQPFKDEIDGASILSNFIKKIDL